MERKPKRVGIELNSNQLTVPQEEYGKLPSTSLPQKAPWKFIDSLNKKNGKKRVS